MKIRIIITAGLIALLSGTAHAQAKKETIIIYDLTMAYERSFILDRNADAGKAVEQQDYYARIISRTVARDLSEAGGIIVKSIDEEMPLKGFGSDEFYEKVRKTGAEHGAHYCVGGRGTIRGKKILIELAVIDLRGKDFFAVSRETFETGAELMDVITELSSGIRNKLGEYRKKYRTIESTSPFLKAYRAMDGLSFGIRTGHFFLKGAFARVYEDGEYVSPYASFDILRWLGASLQADYLTANNGSIKVIHHSSMLLWGITLNADFTWRLTARFGLTLTAGSGASSGTIFLYSSDNPFRSLIARKYSVDPYLNTAVSFWLQFDPIVIQFGPSFKASFFKGDSLYFLTVFFGLGYHL